MTPKGQMSGNGSGPAIMMMPAHIRATFMPDPPLKHLPQPKRQVPVADTYLTADEENESKQTSSTYPKVEDRSGPSGIATIKTSFPSKKRGLGLSGISSFLHHFERTAPPSRKVNPTPKSIKDEKKTAKKAENDIKLAPLITEYREEQRKCSGEFKNGMNCYNTLFVGRLAYEVTERKLLREMEAYGPVKDIKLITNPKNRKSRGYAFVEFEREDDMKRAFRAADGMRLEGRSIVVDVERGHTVPNWLPRRLGGGLGGTRLGGKDRNVTIPGRYDPSKAPPPQPPHQLPHGGAYGNVPPPPQYGGHRGGSSYYGGGGRSGGYGGPPPPSYGNGGDRGGYGRGGSFNNGPPARDRGGRDEYRKRRRSRSPDRERRRGRY